MKVYSCFTLYDIVSEVDVFALCEDEIGVRRFMREVSTQWRSLSMETRSVRSMLDEVLSNWEKYSRTVASLQTWLEDAEEALTQPENTRRV